MELPVVFLTFANDNSAHLGLLDEERKLICEHLIPLESKQFFQLYREPTATTDDIIDYLTKFKDRVILFHYGGHADSDSLMMTDQEGDAGGVAQLLAQQDKLKVVFLNGCSTKGQVDLLLNLGIPAVIASSVPINDTTAKDFAANFYLALANDHNLREAFEIAAGGVKFREGSDLQIHRGLKPRAAQAENVLPWGLYLNENNPDVLSWKLPKTSNKEIVIESTVASIVDRNKFVVNNLLTQELFQALAPYNDFLEFAMFKHQKGEEIDIRKIRQSIMDCLPAPIGDQVRRLFALDEVNLDRLEQLIHTYNSLAELVTFTMLTQLWDVKHINPNLAIPNESLEVINHYFELPTGQLSYYDYFKLLSAIRQVFDDNNVDYFVDELSELRRMIYEDIEYTAAHQYIQTIKQQLYKTQEKLSAEEVTDYCIEIEKHLGKVFNTFGFLVKYKLVTVKEIGLIKARHQEPEYNVIKVHLDNITAGLLDEQSVYDTFTDSNSVILLKSKKDLTEYLNLSPFIIDENALLGEKKSKLFFFSHFDKNSGTYHYKFSYNAADKLSVSEEKYPSVKTDLQNFIQLILG